MEKQQIVLIVDDEKINRDLLADLLEPYYKVMLAKNGEQALKAASRKMGQPDLVLLDIMMPGMDGFEVCRRLKEAHNTREIPVIFVTAIGEVANETKGFDVGAVDYIRKPISPSIALARVKTHLRLKRKSDLLENLGSLDALTEIPNRRAFNESLEKEWACGKRLGAVLSIVLIDIDMFKRYNDNYGHKAGDGCLQRVAQALAGVIQRPQGMVARYGGEEFCAILPDTSFEGAKRKGEKFRTAVANLAIPHAHSEAAPHVTISIGVCSVVPEDSVSSQELLKQADKNLFTAKQKGRNQVFGECSDIWESSTAIDSPR